MAQRLPPLIRPILPHLRKSLHLALWLYFSVQLIASKLFTLISLARFHKWCNPRCKWKDEPQRLKPSHFAAVTARLKPCPDESECRTGSTPSGLDRFWFRFRRLKPTATHGLPLRGKRAVVFTQAPKPCLTGYRKSENDIERDGPWHGMLRVGFGPRADARGSDWAD
jgi:hypothetical protein